MIKVNFDKYGKIRNLDFGDEVIFKGNNRVNQIFVAFDDVAYNPNHYMTYSALINENDYEGNLTDLATAKTTIDGVEGYTFYLFSNLTAKAGELKLSVRLVDRTSERVLVSGIIPLVIEDTAISTYASVDITKTQYNALLTAFDELSQSIDATNFKTINGESIYGEGDIVVLTGDVMVNYVGQEISAVNDSLWNLSQRISDVETENAELNALIEKQEKKIEQLELASEGNILSTITESDSAYEVDVSVDTLPYATIDKIGGMTYKSDNILQINDIEATTINGLTYKVENGVIYLNGTLTTKTAIQFNLKKPIVSGTYSYKNLGNGITDADSRLIMYKLTSSGSTSYVDDLLQNTTETLNLSQEADVIKFSISAGTYTNATIKPIVVKGNTIPTKFIKGFEGLRDSKVTEIINHGANLLDFDDVSTTAFNGVNYSVTNGEIKVSGTANAGGTFFIAINSYNMANAHYLKLFKSGTFGTSNHYFTLRTTDNQTLTTVNLVSGDSATYTSATSVTLNRIAISIVSGQTYNFTIKPMLVKGATAPTTFKPYKQPTTIAIPTAIQNLDGYGIGVDATYYNYVDFESKKFVRNVKKNKSTTTEKFQVYATNTSGGVEINLGVVNSDLLYEQRYKIIYSTNINHALINGYSGNKIAFVPTQSGNYLLINRSALPNIDSYTLNSSAQKQYILTTLGIDEIVVDYIYVITPIAEGLSHIIDGEILTEVESGGTLTFENEYKQDVPFTWTFQEKL